MSSKMITLLLFLTIGRIASADVLCSEPIQKKAEEMAASKFGGTCIAQIPEAAPGMNLRGAAGSVSGICKKNISDVSVERVPFTFSFSVSAMEYNRDFNCDGAFTVTE